MKQTIYLLLCLIGLLQCLTTSAQDDKEKEKIKEIESKRFDFRIDKVVVFVNVFDEDLQNPSKGNLKVTNGKGEVIQNIENEAFSQLRLPIQDTYTVAISSEGYEEQTFNLDLRKVTEYETRRNIYLKPKKQAVRVSAKEFGRNPQELSVKLQNQNLNERVTLQYDAASNEFYGMARPNQDYQLEVRNPKNNYTYSQGFRPSNDANENKIAVNAENARNIARSTYIDEDELTKLKRPRPASINIDSLIGVLGLSKTRIPIDSAAVFEGMKRNNTENENTANKREENTETDPENYQDLVLRTKEDMERAEKALVDRQNKVREHLEQLNEYLDSGKLSESEKANLKEVILTLEEQLLQYDREYQRLRTLNFQELDRLQNKMGIRTFNSFFRQFWYLFIILFVIIGILFVAMVVFYFIARTRRKQRDQLAELNEEINQQNEEITAQRDAIEEKNKLIEIERQKSDELLLNILPLKVADELKTFGKAKMRNYESVSILFTDFKGFTNVAATMTPDKLMDELNDCFTAFDTIIAKHGLEKIKTIGDAYMCAGGIPEPNDTNPIDAVLAGLEMQEFMQRRRKERLEAGDDYWQCRLGINTGEVRAGVIGTSKFAYDIWGDPVNIASRMESGGAVNKVNISEQTYQIVKDFFEFTPRGEVEVKNGLFLNMYFVERIKPELSADEEGLTPNNKFINLKYERFGQITSSN